MAPTLSRILFVEDDPDIQVIAKLALQSVGKFTVEICNSGREAISVAPVFAPDLIVLDVMLPEFDGLETFQALRDIPKIARTPVIFLTAKVQAHEIKQYRQMGALDVIAKPFDPMTLAAQIYDLWKRHHDG
ncbi:MAG: response regulator [Oculatellaceae cyanobacterium bins.114]|nr:response regulator [Oculatellaceae cyanobacterium bins.114]